MRSVGGHGSEIYKHKFIMAEQLPGLCHNNRRSGSSADRSWSLLALPPDQYLYCRRPPRSDRSEPHHLQWTSRIRFEWFLIIIIYIIIFILSIGQLRLLFYSSSRGHRFTSVIHKFIYSWSRAGCGASSVSLESDPLLSGRVGGAGRMPAGV